MHGRAKRHASVRRVPVERACAVRPHGDADEGNAAGRRGGRRWEFVVGAGRTDRQRPVQDCHGDTGTGCAAQVHRGQPGVLRGTAGGAGRHRRRGRSAVRARSVDADRTQRHRRLQDHRNSFLPHGQDKIFELLLIL